MMTLLTLSHSTVAKFLALTFGAGVMATADREALQAFQPAEQRDAILAEMRDSDIAAYCAQISGELKTRLYVVSGSEQADPSVESATAWAQILAAQSNLSDVDLVKAEQRAEHRINTERARHRQEDDLGWLATQHRACLVERAMRFEDGRTDSMFSVDDQSESIKVDYVGDDFTGDSSEKENKE